MENQLKGPNSLKYQNLKKYLILFSLYYSISCNQSFSKNPTCIVLEENILKKYDSSKFKITNSRTAGWSDVIENPLVPDKKCLYEFDENKRLRFFAYLINDSDYIFSYKYDSLGNIIGKTGDEVVKWFSSKPSVDSLQISFLLFSLNFSYIRNTLIVNNDTFSNVKLYKSRYYTNLIGGSATTVIKRSEHKGFVYLTGERLNKCSRDTTFYADSISLESAFTKK
ncbi:MAG TPA: hypothetical protein VK772_14360 [Puia sp.]|jgi:hypothetical protein|nr:hypothetical protein [Puia sp.]